MINYKFIYIHISLPDGNFLLSNEQREITLILPRLEMILVRKEMDVTERKTTTIHLETT
jgi:hypothetical protein